MSRRSRVTLVGAVFFATMAFAGCMGLVQIDVSGVWQGQLLWTGGPASGFTSPISLDLLQDDRQVYGTITLLGPGSLPFPIEISHGQTTGTSVHIEASGINDIVAPPVTVAISLDGTAADGTLSGTGEQTIGSNTYPFSWTADLVAPPPTEP